MKRTSFSTLCWSFAPILLGLALFAGTVFTGTADAVPIHEIEIFYYSDSSHTTQVGHRFRPCYGSGFMEGTQTEYFTTYTAPCA